MPPAAQLNPTLFDKLTGGGSVSTIVESGRSELEELNQAAEGKASETGGRIDLDRYSERALRASVRRELSWLLNTVNLAATLDFSRTPHVVTSVLNYGLPDLTGRASTTKAVEARAREIQTAITTYEPRLDPKQLHVTAREGVGEDNAVNFLIRGNVTAAVNALPVQFYASVEVETGEAVVKD